MSRNRGGKKSHAKRSGKREPKGPSINKMGLIVAIVALLGLFGLVIFLGEPPPPPEGAAAAAASDAEEREIRAVEEWQDAELHEIPVDPARDFVRGPLEAPVTIVEFTDFQCPYCKIAHGYVEEVLGRYPNDVRLVYKNYPLDMTCNDDMGQQLHPYACKAAVMARCAGHRAPDLFWRFHDDVFEGGDLSDAWLDAKAEELGVADEAFDACVSGRDEFEEVRADIELADSIGVNSTPSFYINGRRAPSYEIPALVEVIEHILDSD